MTIQEMHTSLKLELDKSDSLNNLSFEPEEIDYWINRAIKLFVKTRYSGSNYKRDSFEQTQKRTDDLRTLVTYQEIDLMYPGGYYPDSYNAELPENYMFALGERVLIVYNPYLININNEVESGSLLVGSYYMVIGDPIDHNTITYQEGDIFEAQNDAYQSGDGNGYVIELDKAVEGITQVTIDTYDGYINSPYSEHRLHYYSARPLRLFQDNLAILISDGQYNIIKYYLHYLRYPVEVSLSLDVDCDLPDHTHEEIISTAVDLMVENVESPRLQTRQAVAITE